MGTAVNFAVNFTWPWVFILLPLPLWFWIRQNSLSAANALPVSQRLATALDDIKLSTGWRMNRDKLLAWLIWGLLLLALAQPGRPDQASVQPASGRALAVAIDLSGSMEREDFDWQGESANRLSVVKAVANEFIAARAGDRLSLVLFASEAYVAAPLTFDLAAVQHQLASAGIGMAGRATGIGDAIGLAIQSLSNDPATEKAIVLLSDGTNNAGAVEPESAAALAAERGIRVHTIALGSDREREDAYSMAPSADLDEASLENIALSAGGAFFRARTSEDLENIYTTIDQLERAEAQTPPVVVRSDLRHWPLLALFVCLCIRSLLRRTAR